MVSWPSDCTRKPRVLPNDSGVTRRRPGRPMTPGPSTACADGLPAPAATIRTPTKSSRRWDREYDIWRRERAEARGRAYIDRHFDFSRFRAAFPVARGMGRRLVLMVGADQLRQDPPRWKRWRRPAPAFISRLSGCWRWRVSDRLNRDGIPTTLLTGEEEVRMPGCPASVIDHRNARSR